MFNIWDSGKRVTINPISFNFLLHFFNGMSIDVQKISSLLYDEAYEYKQFVIARAV